MLTSRRTCGRDLGEEATSHCFKHQAVLHSPWAVECYSVFARLLKTATKGKSSTAHFVTVILCIFNYSFEEF